MTHILRRHGPKHVRVCEKDNENEDIVCHRVIYRISIALQNTYGQNSNSRDTIKNISLSQLNFFPHLANGNWISANEIKNIPHLNPR